jgi:hypothetical protein
MFPYPTCFCVVLGFVSTSSPACPHPTPGQSLGLSQIRKMAAQNSTTLVSDCYEGDTAEATQYTVPSQIFPIGMFSLFFFVL